MKPFPEDYELIGFFEAEPKVLDLSIPWFYNRLEFEVVRDTDRVECVIEPSDRILQFRWTRIGQGLVSLDLYNVEGLRLERERGRECLVGAFDSELGEVRLYLRPQIQLLVCRDAGP